jgi:hypothetical protein
MAQLPLRPLQIGQKARPKSGSGYISHVPPVQNGANQGSYWLVREKYKRAQRSRVTRSHRGLGSVSARLRA